MGITDNPHRLGEAHANLNEAKSVEINPVNGRLTNTLSAT
jgi:hypothetical protein